MNIKANFLKNRWQAYSICLTFATLFSPIGLYSSANTTAPNPPSNNDIKLKNCVIDELRPLISEPKLLIINRGKIRPEIVVASWRISAVIKFFLLFTAQFNSLILLITSC